MRKCLGEVPQLAWRGGSQRSDGEAWVLEAGGQGGHRPAQFFGLGGGTGGTKKWYQHLQVINKPH